MKISEQLQLYTILNEAGVSSATSKRIGKAIQKFKSQQKSGAGGGAIEGVLRLLVVDLRDAIASNSLPDKIQRRLKSDLTSVSNLMVKLGFGSAIPKTLNVAT